MGHIRIGRSGGLSTTVTNVSPSAAPTQIGAHWINTVTGEMWSARGTSSVDDWVLEVDYDLVSYTQFGGL